MSAAFDLVIVGAGPAGMSAAIAARGLGLSVAVVDEQSHAGGQIHRAVELAHAAGRAPYAHDAFGLALVAAFRRCGALHLDSHQVWHVERDGRVYASNGRASRVVCGARVLLTVGAHERPVPIPGWTLPGVMTVGAAQILHKTAALLPAGDVWIAGSGPLALLYAATVLGAGGQLAGWLDTTDDANRRAARAQWRSALAGWRELARGAALHARIGLARLARRRRVDAVEALGDSRLRRVRWRADGRWHEAPAGALLLHEGVIPNVQFTRALGCVHDWHDAQQCFAPRVDMFGASSLPRIYVAGDAAGIVGGPLARERGALAAVAIAESVGRIDADERDRRAAPLLREIARLGALRPFLDARYRAPARVLAPADAVIACRCEALDAGRLRDAIARGARDPDHAKMMTRCGMGPCQARLCGTTLNGIIAAATGRSAAEVGALRVRPPLQPVPLGELAALEASAALASPVVAVRADEPRPIAPSVAARRDTPREADVIVIGGGLHACSAALQLAQRGRRVIVLERRHVARHASGANAGGVRTLWRDPAEIALAIEGMRHWRQLRELVGDDGGFVACGQVRVAESADEMAALEARVARLAALGYSHERLIDAATLRRRVPALATHCVGALVVDDDGAADPHRTSLAFAARARAVGARVIEGEGCTAIERAGDAWHVRGERGTYRAPAIVNAAGAWAAQVAAMVGDHIPLRTRASMMMVTERVPAFVAPVVSAQGRALTFKQTVAGTVLVGGGQQGRADLAHEQSHVDFDGIAVSARAVCALFPSMRPVRVVRAWTGIEAETPDRLPVIDHSPSAPGVVHVFGFSGHGFQLGPVCGVAVADLVTEGTSRLPIAAFRATRFGGPDV